MALTRSQRRARARRKALYNPSVALSGGNLSTAAKQVVGAELNPQISALRTQGRNTTTQGTALMGRAGDYYSDLATREQGQLARTEALMGLMKRDVGAAGQSARAGYDAAYQGQQAADQKTRGVIGAGFTDAGMARAGEAYALNRGNFENQQAAGERSTAAQAGNWQGLQGTMAQVRGARGGEIQGQLANRLANQQQDVNSKVGALEGTRGAKTMDALLKLRQQAFENAVTQRGLGIKQADIAATLAGIDERSSTADKNRRAANRRARRQTNTTRRGQDISAGTQQRGQDLSHEDRQASNQRQARKDRQKARAQGAKTWGKVETLGGMISNAKFTNPDGTVRKATRGEAVQSLRGSGKYEAWQIDAARDIDQFGYVTPATLRRIKRLAPGVRIPPRFLQAGGTPIPRQPHGGAAVG